MSQTRRGVLHPAEYYASVCDIDLAALKSRGIVAVLIDLDNTLVPWHSYLVNPEVAAWVTGAGEIGVRICIVSNANSRKRLARLAGEFGVPFAEGPIKPFAGGFLDGMKRLEARPEQTAVVGDQIFTDILGGNRLGLYTILVRPMARREFVGTKISRFFEWMILRGLGMEPIATPAGRGTIEGEQPSDESGALS